MAAAATGSAKAKRKFLTPEAIQSVEDRPINEVKVDVGGKEMWLRIRPLSQAQYDVLDREATVMKERKIDGETVEVEEVDEALLNPRLIAACCCDANGEPIFTLEQAEDLMERLSLITFTGICAQIVAVMGLGGGDAFDKAKDTFPAGDK